jgi:1,4-dihydroxy-2-naphthoate octaprenyltransferase
VSLLTAHRILVSAALALAVVLVAWGAVHGLVRHEPSARAVFVLGLVALPVGLLYLRKLWRNPPLH